MAMSEERENQMVYAVSRYTAIIVPLVEAGVVGYATWVLTDLLCIQYLLHPSEGLQDIGIRPRKAPAIVILTLYFLILLIMMAAYFRLVQIIWSNPGLIPIGSKEKEEELDRYFERHEAFICDYQGKPRFCEKCNNYKPDRTHHCSQIGRCVRRMDHFCPWVGGIVSETSHKFFLQFLFYGFLYWSYVTVVFGYYSAERQRKFRALPATWIVTLALSGIFLLFVFGMLSTTAYQAFGNYTTVEALDRKYQVYHIALRPDPYSNRLQARFSDQQPQLPESTVSSNRPHKATELTPPAHKPMLSESTTISSGPTSTPISSDQSIQGSTSQYIICQTQPGENPWDLGTRENWKHLMGEHWWDWFLPLKFSPHTRHDQEEGHYQWGPVVDRLRRENGLGRRRRHRKDSRREIGHEGGYGEESFYGSKHGRGSRQGGSDGGGTTGRVMEGSQI
ncbi:zf-DHHC-domain-containing protein [Delitschia confertaspora ATCC 74209]|uniref:Palmitoyltransferase n=1 Tax=Delitschia confertaspora ATCC 74209 TaxID=1513339 RepID=A0A9P4JRD1_9PLEO|nr:zf-DHHC-domain-containing protein [Delitschia confertaspora ATCC 74209]